MKRRLYPAMLTPLKDGGEQVDADAFQPMIDFLIGNGADGLFVLGTTGEGINFNRAERNQVSRLAKAALTGRGQLLVHCGAQTTRETMALAHDAAELGVDGVAVIPPPYFALDDRELLGHFAKAAAVCNPTPFFVYSFSPRSGYQIPVSVIDGLTETAPNFAGLKVSEAPFERLAPYLKLNLPVYVGNEPLIAEAAALGTIAGSVSAIASVFPDIMRALLDEPTANAAARVASLRQALSQQSLIATAKAVLSNRGLPIKPDMRAPLRPLDPSEAADALHRVAAVLGRLDSYGLTHQDQ